MSHLEDIRYSQTEAEAAAAYRQAIREAQEVMIAKIPPPLARFVARTYHPDSR